MSFLQLTIVLLSFAHGIIHRLGEAAVNSFDKNYIVKYGFDHFSQLVNGLEVQLSFDKASGAGFMSKKSYSSGLFQMMIKLPAQPSPGVVSSFYLTSQGEPSDHHDEIDFGFLGTDGPPFMLQTNIFANDNGRREQRLRLWFDPRKDFHKYGILWNNAHIVFYVDNVPVRVYKNIERLGVRYPKNPMFVEGSIWNGDDWASGGKKVDWSKAPFQIHYRGFNIAGCESGQKCPPNTWWNTTEVHQSAYEHIKKNYVIYDYCSDKGKYFKECQLK